MTDHLVNPQTKTQVDFFETIATEEETQKVKSNFLLRLKEKWGVTGLFQVVLILIAFSLAGSTVVVLRKGLFQLVGFTDHTPFLLKTITYILFVFPCYQILILAYGTLLGQFNFFWEKEKKLFRGIRSIFWKKRS